MHFLVIGGSDAGISAALRARELDSTADVTVVLEDDFPNYSICGLPFYLSGETPDWHDLAHRKEFGTIDVRRRHRASVVDPHSQTVAVEADGRTSSLRYDKLLLATGAGPTNPPILGWQTPGVFLLHSMADSFAVFEYLERVKPARAVIVGAGYIGLEMADALTHRGIVVTIASRTATVLPTVDAEFGLEIQRELEAHGVTVRTEAQIARIERRADHLHVEGCGFDAECEMVIVAVGTTPNAALGVDAGIKTGLKGALLINRKMESAVPNIYVAGDCAETWHRVLGRYTYLPLGTTAHKQGRVAGENAAGGERTFAGALGTQVVKIFSKVAGRTGLRQDEAARESFTALTVASTSNDHKAYYPGATTIAARVTGDTRNGKLLGAQILGTYGAEISKRLDVFATALHHGMLIEEISDLDLSYTPPLSSPWDPVQMAAQAWSAANLTTKPEENR